MRYKNEFCAIYASTKVLVVATSFNEGRSHGYGIQEFPVDSSDVYRQIVRAVNQTCEEGGRAVLIDNESDPVIGTIERFQGPGFIEPNLLRGHSLVYVEGSSEHQALAAWVRGTSITAQRIGRNQAFEPQQPFSLIQFTEVNGKVRPSVCEVDTAGQVVMLSSHTPRMHHAVEWPVPSIAGVPYDYTHKRALNGNFAVYMDVRTPALYERTLEEVEATFRGLNRKIGLYSEPNAIPRGGVALAEALVRKAP